MSQFNRRQFIRQSVGFASVGLAAGIPSYSQQLWGQEPAKNVNTFVPEIIFLTWQQDPTTTMTVSWIGAEKALTENQLYYRIHDSKNPKVWQAGPIAIAKHFPVIETAELRAEAAKSSKKPIEPPTKDEAKFTGPIDYIVHRAELTQLLPGMEYDFSIGKDGKTFRFRTMPKKATDDFHFVSGGDCGVNSHVIANNRLAAAQDPMFVLIGGDLGYDNGTSGNVALNFIRNYSQTMIDSKGRLIPLVTCLGNHEVRGGYNKTLRDATFFTPLFGGLYNETSYASLDFGDYLSLILLDSGHCAKVEGEQTTWLEKQLKQRSGISHLIPVNHVPCYPSYRPPESTEDKKIQGTGKDQRKHWVPLFEQYEVDIVLEHHDHTFKRTKPLLKDEVDERKGITYLGDGSWGRLRVPNDAEKRSYLQDVKANYHLTLHRLEGEQRFHVSISENNKVLDIYRTGKRLRG